MIQLTRLDGKELWVNSDQILTVEATPDTVILLQGGMHLMVREAPEDVVDRALAYRRRIAAGPTIGPGPGPGPGGERPERHCSVVPLPPRPPAPEE